MAKIGDWMKSSSWLANAGHVGWGALITLTAFTLGGHRALDWTASVLLGLVVFKEYVADPYVETGEDWKTGSVDLAGWVGGMALTFGLVWLKSHL